MPYVGNSAEVMMAEQDGEVIELSDSNIRIKYKDGTEKSFVIGPTYGASEGITYLHELVTNLKKGSKFKKGSPIYYHKDFFEPDYYDPSKLVFKMNRVTIVALEMSSTTYEDSSAASISLYDDLVTTTVAEVSVIRDFDITINNLVEIGQEVMPQTALFVTTETTHDAGNLTEAGLSMLEAVASGVPRAGKKGIVSHYEIKYNGDVNDMSPSVRKIARQLDKEIAQRTKGTAYEATDNRVTGEYTTGGQKLGLDQFELKVFIKVVLGAGGGDKFVLSNQAKTVVSDIYTHKLTGEITGDSVEMTFSRLGFDHRIIDSPMRAGALNRYMRLSGLSIAKEYFDS